MILLQLRISDSYAYDGTSLQVVGVFSNMDMIKKMLFADHAGEILDHKEDARCNQGSFTVKYHNGNYLTYERDCYEYDLIELDKKI